MAFFNIYKDKYLRIIAVLSLLILFLAAAIFYFQSGANPFRAEKSAGQAAIPLIIRFEADKGVDFLAGQMEVFGILLSALAIILINFFLADFLYHRERFLSYILGFASLAIIVLILIVISVIVHVN